MLHAVHVEAKAAAYVPVPQSVHVEEAVTENVPGPHPVQVAEPSVRAYVPLAQAALSFASPAHQKPTGHSVPSADTVPGGQYLPAATVQSCLS